MMCTNNTKNFFMIKCNNCGNPTKEWQLNTHSTQQEADTKGWLTIQDKFHYCPRYSQGRTSIGRTLSELSISQTNLLKKRRSRDGAKKNITLKS